MDLGKNETSYRMDTQIMNNSQDRSQKRVKTEQVEALLNSAETQEHIFWGKELVVSYRLPCGFTVTGRGACIDPALFDVEIGRKVARENALHQLWQLEGYLLQMDLYRSSHEQS